MSWFNVVLVEMEEDKEKDKEESVKSDTLPPGIAKLLELYKVQVERRRAFLFIKRQG